MEIGIWDVSSGKPQRFERGTVDLEKQLEDWIAHDPSMVQHGLTIVGRQVRTDAGILDLLALDLFGNWAVIEIKRGSVSDQTVTQGVRYAACISELPPKDLTTHVENYLKSQGKNLKALLKERNLDMSIFEPERSVIIFVVGTGRDPNLERMSRFMKKMDAHINIVSFEVLQSPGGQRLIQRHLTELDNTTPIVAQPAPPPETKPRTVKADIPAPTAEIERLFKLARKNKVGEEFRLIYDVATKHGLFPRTYKWSIMYTPPQNKTRVAICAWVKPRYDAFDIAIVAAGFSDFYPVTEQEVIEILGLEGPAPRYSLLLDEVKLFTEYLDDLFAVIDDNSKSGGGV